MAVLAGILMLIVGVRSLWDYLSPGCLEYMGLRKGEEPLEMAGTGDDAV